ncbi:MAG: aspartate aminotransferase family protein [Paracoccaceae bacterium]
MTRYGDAMPNAYRPGAATLSDADAALIARRDRVLGPAYRLFYENPVHLVRGEGVWLYDKQGDAYLDAYNNVACVGHCHSRVVAAMAEQAATYASHTRYLHDGVLAYAERLLTTFPATLGHVMFTCTGSEANDLALRIAFQHTGGTGVIVTENAYHGVTHAVAGLSPSLGRGVPLSPSVRVVPAPRRQCGGGTGATFASHVKAAIDDMTRHGIRPAALIVDTIFSSDGVLPHPEGFLAPAVMAIRAAGGLFIADEVQAGFGRTGSQMWGFARHGVEPDMVSLGKPMGNGYPVAGLVLRPEVVAEFGENGRYFNTFGGNPVAVATAGAVLDVIDDEGLLANAADVGDYLASGLRELAVGRDALGEIRNAGLFIGADILDDGRPDAARAARLVNAMREARVLISASGLARNVLKIRPPLVFSRENADHFLDRMATALKAL